MYMAIKGMFSYIISIYSLAYWLCQLYKYNHIYTVYIYIYIHIYTRILYIYVYTVLLYAILRFIQVFTVSMFNGPDALTNRPEL
jgi:hypothetical protein